MVAAAPERTALPRPTEAAPSVSPVAGPSVSLPEPPLPDPSPPVTTLAAAQGAQAGLARARSLVEQQRWEEALAVARAVLETAPTNAEATTLAQQAEAEIVIERCLRNARAALRQGDRELALEEIRNGFLVRTNDPRLIELHREAVQP